MGEYTVVREYPYPVEEVWEVLTSPRVRRQMDHDRPGWPARGVRA